MSQVTYRTPCTAALRKTLYSHSNYVPNNSRSLMIEKYTCGFSNNLNVTGCICSLEGPTEPSSGSLGDQATFSI